MTASHQSENIAFLKKQLEAIESERSTLSRKLKESEDRYERVLENLKDEYLFFSHDKHGNFTFASPSYNNILGYTPEEYMGMNASQFWSPHKINKVAERATQLACQGIKQPPYEFEIYHKSGALRRFVVIETPIFDDQGEVIAVEGTSRDITEKRKIEEQLDKYRKRLEELVKQRTEELEVSRKQLADIIEFLPHPIVVVEMSGAIIAWNRAMVEMTGLATGEVQGQNYRTILQKFYGSSDPSLLDVILQGQGPEEIARLGIKENCHRQHPIEVNGTKLISERRVKSPITGLNRDIWISAGPILNHEEKIIGAIESLQDITHVKQAEKRIIQSERRLQTLMNNLPGMAYRISLVDENWRVDFVSEGCKQIFGRESAFFIGRDLSAMKDLIHPDDLQRVIKLAQKAVDNMDSFESEYRIVTQSGVTKWVFDKTDIVSRNVDGRISAEGFMADFTVFKKKEQSLTNENILLRSKIRDRYKFESIIGNCRPMQEVFDLILKAASAEDNVFVFGESGTGKELVAKAIHDASDRKHRRFIAVNCAAIPENLIESEFFGTAKGAFTGASGDKKGYLETADGGTIFLDEIGDISMNLQVKLLRAIDDGGFSPVGSRKVIRPDIRIIAASNKDLRELMQSGDIRQDFFFRIHVIPIHLPPLRERGDDIFLLINHFFKEFGDSDTIASFSGEELETLRKHHWPGNVRELQNVLRRFVTMRNLHFMDSFYFKDTASVPQSPLPPQQKIRNLKEAILEMEKQEIRNALEQTHWNRSKAAQELGLSRRTLFRKMKTYELI